MKEIIIALCVLNAFQVNVVGSTEIESILFDLISLSEKVDVEEQSIYQAVSKLRAFGKGLGAEDFGSKISSTLRSDNMRTIDYSISSKIGTGVFVILFREDEDWQIKKAILVKKLSQNDFSFLFLFKDSIHAKFDLDSLVQNQHKFVAQILSEALEISLPHGYDVSSKSTVAFINQLESWVKGSNVRSDLFLVKLVQKLENNPYFVDWVVEDDVVSISLLSYSISYTLMFSGADNRLRMGVCFEYY